MTSLELGILLRQWSILHNNNDNGSWDMTMILTTYIWQLKWQDRYDNYNDSRDITMVMTAEIWQWYWQHIYDSDNDSGDMTTILIAYIWQL